MERKNATRTAKKGLGRGLSSLISSSPAVPVRERAAAALKPELVKNEPEAANNDTTGKSDISYLSIEMIINNPSQPRQEFSEEELQELQESIMSRGVLQPILVRKSLSQPGKFQIVAGERRWRAAKRAKLSQMPVIIKDLSDADTLEIALVENIQRSNLNPLEEAKAYKQLMTELHLNQQEISDRVGKRRASVANLLRLLKLPDEVSQMLREGKLTSGHAKAILTVKEPSVQISLAKMTVEEGLSVRALEKIVSRKVTLEPPKKEKKSGEKGENADGEFAEIISRLRRSLGTKIKIKHKASGKGKIELEYYSNEELERLVEQLAG